jgi:hypothetical protein
MRLPKQFMKLNATERIKYAMKKKQEYEKKAEQWTVICRKLVTDKDFTPLEIDLIDTVLEKDESRH